MSSTLVEAVGAPAPAAQPDQVRSLFKPWPEAWERRLREFSPVSDNVSWLAGRWHPDIQRWVLYECQPVRYIADNVLIADLQGPDPESPEGIAQDITVSRYQQEMFRKHRVLARLFWIIEGPNGGHPFIYPDSTRELCKATGRPADPPEAGSLPYADFDERVVAKVQENSRLVKVRGDLGELFRRYGKPENWKWEKREAYREARKQWLRHLDSLLVAGDDEIKDAVRKGELDDAPRTDEDVGKLEEAWDESFINKGFNG